MKLRVNQNSSLSLDFVVQGLNNESVSPPLVYTVTDTLSGTVVRAETTLTVVDGEFTLNVTPDDSVILDEANTIEERLVLFTANKGESNQFTMQLRLDVINLQYVESA